MAPPPPTPENTQQPLPIPAHPTGPQAPLEAEHFYDTEADEEELQLSGFQISGTKEARAD